MFSFFSQSKRVAGVEISSRHIRFVEILHEKNFNRITAYGEIISDEIIFENGVFKDEKLLIGHLKAIKNNLKTSDWIVSLSSNELVENSERIFRKIGIKPKKYLAVGTALINSCVPNDSQTSFLVVNIDPEMAYFVITSPDRENLFYQSSAENHSVISNLNHIYIDWYDAHKEKIHHVMFAGARAKDGEFLDYVSRETKIHVTRANIFTNLKPDPESVPIITKEDSYKYAVAVGLAIG